MLQLKDVCKSYTTADFTQVALNHVSLAFRDNEFVAILGPSGSGKTTMLNIIGGLDHYDSGDLLIDGISTKQYRDRDWDTYRNNRIGFVFQAYNLIPHQTILENVELALTLSGVSRAERRERACAALERVGLREHINKKPSQLSGGQMQRVAIARALVNEPEIILADEPTGALDSKTSVQIMNLLTEIAGDRLVIMVTHNPELAEQYATRIAFVPKYGKGAAHGGWHARIAPMTTLLTSSAHDTMRRHKKGREYSVGEEIGNSITHGVGAALAVAAIPISIVRAVGDGAGVLLAAALIYSISMLMEYLASTLYHALAVDGAKRVFKVIDHAAIYLFIAGSYTPYCLVTLSESGGVYLCAFVWALAIIGMAAEAFWTFRPRWVSVVIYLIMGWCVVGFLPALVENLAPTGLWLLVAGGICYSIGCVFYVLKKIPFMHMVFHLWVLAGSVLQFFSILLFVL